MAPQGHESGDRCDPSQWAAEAEFFDREAEARALVPLDPAIPHRYAKPSGPWSLDFCFRVAGDLQGRTVLDVGAGAGENSLVLAALGARVTALDISPRSLEVIRCRAELSGLGERISTVCTPLEAWQSEDRFDIIWIDSFLHHVIPNLPLVLRSLRARMAPGGRVIITEPYSPRWLRAFRMALPIPAHGTPGERPLNGAELRLVSEVFPGIHKRSFLFLSRFRRFFRKAESLAGLDAALLQVPGLGWLGGYIVLWT